MGKLDHIFVYGTLQQGFSNQFSELLCSSSEFIGQGQVPGLLYDLGSYPGLVKSDKGSIVYGELYQCLELSKILPILDEYEGDEYIREEVEVICGESSCIAYVYYYIPTVNPDGIISSGNYRDYLKSRDQLKG